MVDYLAANNQLLSRAMELRDNPAILSAIPEIAILSARLETQMSGEATAEEIMAVITSVVPRLKKAAADGDGELFEKAIRDLETASGGDQDWDDIRANIAVKTKLLEVDRRTAQADSTIVPISFVVSLMEQFFSLLERHVGDTIVVEAVRSGCVSLLESRTGGGK